MSNKKLYIDELNKIIGSLSFYVWKPMYINDIEDRVDYIHFRILFNELTPQHYELISIAGNLKFVYSIDMIVDSKGKKYLYIKTTDLRSLIELKKIYEDKMLEFRIHLDYITDKINKYT
jgi:hypothetical protein